LKATDRDKRAAPAQAEKSSKASKRDVAAHGIARLITAEAADAQMTAQGSLAA
jgi:hypothetical protein